MELNKKIGGEKMPKQEVKKLRIDRDMEEALAKAPPIEEYTIKRTDDPQELSVIFQKNKTNRSE